MKFYDKNGNALTLEYGLSKYKDIQHVNLQENPEDIPTGLLSRTVDVLLQEDLINSIKPGDKANITGVLVPIVTLSTIKTGMFKIILKATSVEVLNKSMNLDLSAEELGQIKAIAQREDVRELLTRSLSPSIFGREQMKLSLILLLIGGKEVMLHENKGRIRGDINILFIGDPELRLWTELF